MNACFRVALILLSVLAAGAARASRPIANWDAVPDQLLSKPFNVGVVAFHETGVDVQFEVNGKPAARVKEPTLNARTGVFEYWFTLNPADYPDGEVTLTATALPDGTGNEPRQLQPLRFYANSRGSLTNPRVAWADAAKGSDQTGKGTDAAPYATIGKGLQAAGAGGTVYLKAGEYKLTQLSGPAGAVWTTVSAAPGLAADQVQILTYGKDDSSTGRYGLTHVRWHNVSLYCDRRPGWGSLFYLNKGQETWFDGAALYDKNGRWADSTLFNGASAYLTDTFVRDIANCGGKFQRNVTIARIGADIFRGATGLTAINVRIKLMDKGKTAAHPDFIQFHNPDHPVENVILYNIRCTDMLAQGFFGAAGAASDIAFVNILLEKDPPSAAFRSQLTGKWTHVLLWHVTEVDQLFTFRDSKEISDFDVRDCLFDTFTTDNVAHPSIHIDAVHTKILSWDQKTPLGTHATTGAPCFVDEVSDDYRIRPESPAYQSGVRLPGVPADADGCLYDPVHPNRGAFAKTNAGAHGNGSPRPR